MILGALPGNHTAGVDPGVLERTPSVLGERVGADRVDETGLETEGGGDEARGTGRTAVCDREVLEPPRIVPGGHALDAKDDVGDGEPKANDVHQ